MICFLILFLFVYNTLSNFKIVDMKNFSIYLFFIFMLFSCASTEDSVRTYNIDIKHKATLEDYFEDYSFIRLETNKECLLSTPQKIDVANNLISILDHNKIFLFDMSGKYLSKIDHLGNGHNEYMAIDDYALQDTLVYILSRAQKVILTYSLRNEMVRKMVLKDWYAHICFSGKDTLVLSSENANGSGKNFLVYDVKNKRVIAEDDGFKNNENLLFSSFCPFVGYNKGLLVTHPFDYRVYCLKKNGMEDFCEFRFITKENSDFIKQGVSYDKLLEQTTNRNVVKFLGPLCFVENNMYMTFELFDTVGGLGKHICKIDAKGKVTNVRLSEKFDKKFPYIMNSMGWYDGSLVSIASASWILQMEKDHRLSRFHQLGLTKEDNCIVFFHKLRHFKDHLQKCVD